MFNRGHNLERHKVEYCLYRKQDIDSDEHSPPKKSCDAETGDDEDDVSISSYDENSKNSEDDDEIKEVTDSWLTMIDSAKVTVLVEYEEILKT